MKTIVSITFAETAHKSVGLQIAQYIQKFNIPKQHIISINIWANGTYAYGNIIYEKFTLNEKGEGE